ncbi:LLM class flavin-dependent oxidoreductase [Herbiconiux sp. CPCC 203407]|uniref:LLM class flavin-dependent oxidoreductase n=1 Tax=Herbiconiux oxytropis TaxID=2970915 RepID=A0AA41XAJ3_9MICO|nr:LLM class flavin-dependent oxidoreductase [Herbiconiux oxytropis]MCS5721574.1 LLM class flavin-dependent oxidoreductase [Herbiconiux oxytropis]MCS5724651.1 LLM class flavin-dependent oxidoreductase [Herbiconiux oxytropis]
MSNEAFPAEAVKFVHQYGVGLHSPEHEYDVHDPAWQKRQVDDFIEFAVLAEDLGFDGLTVTEHHAPQMTCPSPHLLIAAAAMKTSTIRLGTAVTVLPLYHPVRVAEEAGLLDLLSGGRFELGLGRGVPGEALLAGVREMDQDSSRRAWSESLDLLNRMLTGRDVTFDGEFFTVERPTTIATRSLQPTLPIWLGGASRETMQLAGRHGWNIMRNFGSNADHREALDAYLESASAHGFERSGENMMIERFVAIGEDSAQAEQRLSNLASNFGRFISLYTADGRRAVPETDGEFQIDKGSKGRPALAVGGTPEEIIDSLQETIDESGARRILVETFSREETVLFATEVMPVLRARSARNSDERAGVAAHA